VPESDLDGDVLNYLALFDAWMAAGPQRDELLVAEFKDDALAILMERVQQRWDVHCKPKYGNAMLESALQDML
jgi:hypothetical protein